MQARIDPTVITAMSASLSNAELGAAIRLLTHIVVHARAVPLRRAPIIAALPQRDWDDARGAILEFFELDDGSISHSALADSLRPAVAEAPGQPGGRTGELPIVSPTRTPVVPEYSDRRAPERISIKSTAFNSITRLFEASRQSPDTARSVLASLLKTWPEGDVYAAIAQAERQDFIAEPRSWLVKHLQTHSQPVVRKSRAPQSAKTAPAPRSRAPRQLATPAAMGVSERTADSIRQRNAALRLDLQTPEDA